MKKMSRIITQLTVIVFMLASVALAQKQKIQKLDDLPRHTYTISEKLADIVLTDEKFQSFGEQVKTDIENILNSYEIEDKTTLKSLYRTLLRFDILTGDYDKAKEKIELIKTLEEKPADKLLSSTLTSALLQAMQETSDADEMRSKFETYYKNILKDMPWDVVQDDVEGQKGQLEIISQNLILGLIQSQIEPAFEKTGNISRDIAQQLVSFHYWIKVLLPVKENAIAVLQDYIDTHKVEKPDIWSDRNVELDPAAGLNPVIVGIWDSGVDTDIYKGQLFVNTKEKIDNVDNDNNGFIDDVNGIAYNIDIDPTTELLYPLPPEAKNKISEMKDQIKGLQDLQAAIDSPEAIALKKKLSELKPEEVKPFIEELGLFAIYSHGTHVAGISVEGNPYAKILVSRITFDHRMIPIPPTVERAKKDVVSFQKSVDYFKEHNVRVVNMSWGGSLKEVEGQLEANGIGKDAEERGKMAREIFDIEKDGLYNALKSAPEVLFVIAAGNSDNDVAFDEVIPSFFDLPNILTVGAVDQAGEETSFTSFGESVDVHANGFEVNSYVPGGEKMKMSGTSMAAPNVTNLAAKVLACNPDLTPAQVSKIIIENADKSEDGRRILINPKNTINKVKK